MKRAALIMTFVNSIVLCHAQTLFIWPVKKMPSFSEVADFYIVNNFVDSNNASTVQDWNCGNRTYSGHLGIDIDLWPFTWSMMDNNHIAAIAAAPGRVVAAVDNQNNENNCGQTGENQNWNYVAIRHDDSSTSFYGHLRNNSLQVVVGQIVVAGEILGYVGSSGISSNPHLHFEVNSQAVVSSQQAGLIDPYQGSCNFLNSNSRWVAQKPYREPAIVRVMTHGSQPALPDFMGNNNYCRSGEIKNDKANFAPNDSIYFGVAVRDFMEGGSFTLSVFDPNGALWFSSVGTTTTTRNRSYNTIPLKIPAAPMPGTYRAVATYNGTTAVHFFSVLCPASQNVTGAISGFQGYKSSNTITSTATLTPGNRLLLQAANKITFSPGFRVNEGAIMKARIRDCNYTE